MLFETLLFDYEVPNHLEFDILKNPNCSICNSKDVEETAPYFYSSVPNKLIIKMFKEDFNLIITEDEMIEHKKHLRQVIDSDVRKKAKVDFTLIESDITKVIDEDSVVESTIRALTAQRLYLEKQGLCDKEWLGVCQTLHKWVELKLKKEKKVEGDGAKFTFDFGDLFDNGEPNDVGDSDETKVNVQSSKAKD